MCSSLQRKWSQRFPPVVWTLMPAGVAINLGVGAVVQAVKLPVFLDSIGTVLVAALAGPIPAIVTALLTVVVGGVLINPVLPFFAGTAVAIGWFSGIAAQHGAFRKAWAAGLWGLLQGVIGAIVSAPIIVALFGGITQSGSSILVAFLMATGQTVMKSVLLTGIACDPVDKMLTYLIAFALLRGLPNSVKGYFPCAAANLRQPAVSTDKD